MQSVSQIASTCVFERGDKENQENIRLCEEKREKPSPKKSDAKVERCLDMVGKVSPSAKTLQYSSAVLRDPVARYFPLLDQALNSELSQGEAEIVGANIRKHFSSWSTGVVRFIARKEGTELPYTIRLYLSSKKEAQMHLVLEDVNWDVRKVVKKVLIVNPTSFSTVAEIGINVYPHGDDDCLDHEEMNQCQKELDDEVLLIRKLSQNISYIHPYTQVDIPHRNGDRHKYHTDLAETDLHKLISNSNAVLPFKEKLDIIAQLATYLRDLHRNGICHLAITPSNVLRFKDGHVQLCGYGFASSIGAPVNFQGKPGYMAPEMFQEEKPSVNPKLDIWSFGSMVYELLFDGDCAFRGIEEFSEEDPSHLPCKQATETRITELQSKLLELKADPLKEKIYRLAASLLDADPTKRPTAEEVLQTVNDVKASLPAS